MSDKLYGVIVPLMTPTDENDRVDEQALRRLIRHVIDGGCHGVFMGGSTSEAPLLTSNEWVRMMTIGLDEVGDRALLMGGVMESSTARAVEKIRMVGEMGYRNFVVCPTYYITAATPDEHLRHFGACKEAAGDLQMIAYNIPPCTGCYLQVDSVLEMTRRGWISYCKDSSGKPEFSLDMIQRGKDVGLGVFLGQHGYIDRAMLAGAAGLVPSLANYEPQTLVEAYESGAAGDAYRLAKAQARIDTLFTALNEGGTCWIAAVKYAVSTLGIGRGMPVMPLEPVSAEQKQRIDSLTKG